MNKKIIAGILCILTVLSFASCSCSAGNTVETAPPKTYEIEPSIDIGEYATFVTDDKWVDTKSDNYFEFKDDGTYEGSIDGKEYKGVFSLNIVGAKDGVVNVTVTPDGKKEEMPCTITFKNSTDMIFKYDKNTSAHFVAEWTTKQ